jgi:hypothetical protein
MNYDEIVNNSMLPWLDLDINIPHKEILQEAVSLKNEFVKHRDEDNGSGYSHKGWRSLCIHGIDAYKTNHYEQYGYTSNDNTPYIWTDICSRCPITKEFFQDYFPYDTYYRVRYMLLEPQGYITPHIDTDIHKLSPINIALNNPKGCKMKMKGHDGFVPFAGGKAIMLDVGNTHAVYNKSNEDRYHMIVHGKVNKTFKELVERSYAKNGTQ